MPDISKLVINHRKKVIGIILVITVVCALIYPLVHINYKIIDYLPQDSQSVKALNILNDEYPGGIPNARIMVDNLTIPEALQLKEKMERVDGVNKVSWLDNQTSLNVPLEYMGQSDVEKFYRNGTTLYTLTLDTNKSTEALQTIRDMVNDNVKMSGLEVSVAFSGQTINSDLIKILSAAVPIVFIILILTTFSWIDPLLFLFTIGVAIVINMGTNLIFGEISFITQGIAALLQLAIAIDYAMFLLHRFGEYTKQGIEAKSAMALAMKHASTSIVASAITGAVGFSSLLVMRFLVGPDIGWVMIKGIIISLICVFTLLPALTVCCHKLREKTTHRSFMPDLHKFARVVKKVCIPCGIVLLLVLIPSVPAVEHSHYIYSDVLDGPNTVVGKDKAEIKQIFGELSSMALMVPNGNFLSERALRDRIEAIPIVDNVISYSKTVGTEIPQEYVPPDTLKELISSNYTRFVISVNTSIESNEAFEAVETLRALGEEYYPGQWQLAGEIPNGYDMRDCVRHDDILVNIVSIGGIFLVLLFVFRSIITPAILLMVIESAIWITCAIPYFAGNNLYYFARMIIFALLLAATVDYGILLVDRYFEFRRDMDKGKAVIEAISSAGISIITSGAILFVCGLSLNLISSNVLLSALGGLLTIGSVLALFGVLFALPALILIFDKPIQKLTYKANFYQGSSKAKEEQAKIDV